MMAWLRFIALYVVFFAAMGWLYAQPHQHQSAYAAQAWADAQP